MSLLRTARQSLHNPRLNFTSNSRLVSTAPRAQNNQFRNAVSATVLLASGTVLAFYYLDSRSAVHRYAVMPIIRATMDPEMGHKFAVKVLGTGLAPRDIQNDNKNIEVELWGRHFSNPVGLAAGFDKDGEAIEALFNLGFGWVEIGSVTPKPQEGNPRPRLFHLPNHSAIINRYGFNSQGHAVVLSRLRSFLASNPPSSRSQNILALNLGKNKSSPPDSTSDFLVGVEKFGSLVDVLVINVSSPNTPGLRGMQGRGALAELLDEVIKARNALPPRSLSEWKWEKAKVVVKLAPDLNESELEGIAEAVKEAGIDGVIVSNTTVQRPEDLVSLHTGETGGLSGPPLKPLSLKALKSLRSHLPASIPIIGCGGISNGQDALEFAQNGATFIQLYTSFGYGGVGTPRRVKDEIASLLAAKNSTWSDVVASAVSTLSWKKPTPVNPEELLKKQTEELRNVLDEAGHQIAFGEELTQPKEALPHKPPVTEHEEAPASLHSVAEGIDSRLKSVEDLVREAEQVLGIPVTPSTT